MSSKFNEIYQNSIKNPEKFWQEASEDIFWFKKPTRILKKTSEVNALNKELLIKLYREMLLIRRFEEKAGQLYGMGSIGGFCHLYIGQEEIGRAHV